MTTAPVRLFLPNADGLKFLWEKFDGHRHFFEDNLPKDPFGFCTWILQSDAQSFLVGGVQADPSSAQGLFLFTGIVPGDSCFAHIFVWNKEGMTPKDLVRAAQTTCASVMVAHNLHRISGLTPTTMAPARVFAERVGFKIEGTMRKALSHQGFRGDAWFSGLTRADLPEFFDPSVPEENGTIVK